MFEKHTFTILPLIRKARANKEGEVPIYIRITVNGESVEISTKQYVAPNSWDSAEGRVNGNTEVIRNINDTIDALELRAKNYYNQLLKQEKVISAAIIKNLILGISDQNHAILVQFYMMAANVKAMIGKDYRESTYKNYLASQSHIYNYVKTTYKRSDIRLKELDYEFIYNYELYL